MIQMPRREGTSVASSRADEMVLAGSAPTQTPNSDPIGHIHRGTSFIVLVDAAIVVYLIATALNAMGLLNGTLGSVFLGVGMFTGLMIYSGYRNRKAWASWPGVGVLFLASLLFAFLALAVSLVMAVKHGGEVFALRDE